MKKLLSILCSTVVVLSAGTSVIACDSSSSNNNVVTDKTDLSVLNQDSIKNSNLFSNGGWKNITFSTLKILVVQQLSSSLYGDGNKLDINTDFKNIYFYYSSSPTTQISYNSSDTLASDITLLQNNYIYVAFQASSTSTNIINETPEILFTFNSFSNTEILSSAVNYFNSSDFQVQLTTKFFASSSQKVTLQDLSDYLISKESDVIKAIAATAPHRYLNFDKANFKISPPKGASQQIIKIGATTVNLQFSYEGMNKSESININWNYDAIIQQRINSAIKQNSIFMNTDYSTVSTKGSLDSAIVKYINLNLLSDISTNYQLKQATAVSGYSPNKGTTGFSISMDFIDNDGKTISSDNITDGSQSNGQDKPFTFKISTDLINNFNNLANDLNSVTNPSLSLQDLPIGDVIPVTDLPFSSSVSSATRNAITTLFQDRTLGNFLQDFVEVNSSKGAGFGKELDNVTDISQLLLTSNGQDFQKGTPYYNYFDVDIRNFFEKLFQSESGQTIDPGGNVFIFSGSKGITITNSIVYHSATLDYTVNLWNLLKDIAPDIVHFHWFIKDYIEKTGDTNPNYVILLMKYFLDTPKNYLTGLSSGKNDNFTSLMNTGGVKNNLDNLIKDAMDGFQIPLATMQVKGFTGTLSLPIGSQKFNYQDLASQKDPAEQVEAALNSILSPKEGFDAVNGTATVTLNAAAQVPILGTYEGYMTLDLNLSSLHKLEIKKYISDNEAPGKAFSNISGINLNNLNISIVKDPNNPGTTNKLFLKGTGTDSKTQKQWTGDIHSLADLTTYGINFMEFDFRNLELKITYQTNDGKLTNIYVNPNIIPDFYLTF